MTNSQDVGHIYESWWVKLMEKYVENTNKEVNLTVIDGGKRCTNYNSG